MNIPASKAPPIPLQPNNELTCEVITYRVNANNISYRLAKAKKKKVLEKKAEVQKKVEALEADS